MSGDTDDVVPSYDACLTGLQSRPKTLYVAISFQCAAERFCLFLWLILVLTSSDFRNHQENNWCATVGVHNNKVALYENYWTDNRHYICQYNRE